MEWISQALSQAMLPLSDKIDGLSDRMDQMEDHMEQMEDHMDRMEGRMDQMEGRMDQTQNNITAMQQDIRKLQGDVAEIRMVQENEITRDIRVIAEGHLDLARKLDAALREDIEREMLFVRVSRLESQVRHINKELQIEPL